MGYKNKNTYRSFFLGKIALRVKIRFLLKNKN